MMIEIIKPGTKKITKCKNCGCQFSYEEDDIQVANKPPFEKWIVCPQCEKKIAILSVKMPKDASKSVQRRIDFMTEDLF